MKKGCLLITLIPFLYQGLWACQPNSSPKGSSPETKTSHPSNNSPEESSAETTKVFSGLEVSISGNKALMRLDGTAIAEIACTYEGKPCTKDDVGKASAHFSVAPSQMKEPGSFHIVPLYTKIKSSVQDSVLDLRLYEGIPNRLLLEIVYTAGLADYERLTLETIDARGTATTHKQALGAPRMRTGKVKPGEPRVMAFPLQLTLLLGDSYLKLDADESDVTEIERDVPGTLGCIPPRGEDYDWETLNTRLKRIKAYYPANRMLFVSGPPNLRLKLLARAVREAHSATFDQPALSISRAHQCQDPAQQDRIGLPTISPRARARARAASSPPSHAVVRSVLDDPESELSRLLSESSAQTQPAFVPILAAEVPILAAEKSRSLTLPSKLLLVAKVYKPHEYALEELTELYGKRDTSGLLLADLVGAIHGKKWLDAKQAYKFVKQGIRFTVVPGLIAASPGRLQVGESIAMLEVDRRLTALEEDAGPDGHVMAIKDEDTDGYVMTLKVQSGQLPTDEGVYAVAGDTKSVMLRRTKYVKVTAVHRNVVKRIVARRGMAWQDHTVIHVWQVDVMGSGQPQTLIEAWATYPTYPDDEYEEELPGCSPWHDDVACYSFVALIVKGKPTMLTGAFVNQKLFRENDDEPNERLLRAACPNNLRCFFTGFQVDHVLDLNGDGILEIVLRANYMRGSGRKVLTLRNGRWKSVLTESWGT